MIPQDAEKIRSVIPVVTERYRNKFVDPTLIPHRQVKLFNRTITTAPLLPGGPTNILELGHGDRTMRGLVLKGDEVVNGVRLKTIYLCITGQLDGEAVHDIIPFEVANRRLALFTDSEMFASHVKVLDFAGLVRVDKDSKQINGDNLRVFNQQDKLGLSVHFQVNLIGSISLKTGACYLNAVSICPHDASNYPYQENIHEMFYTVGLAGYELDAYCYNPPIEPREYNNTWLKTSN